MSSVSNGTDPSSLEDEIEETRERLAGTIDELIQRTSPKTLFSREVSSIRGQFVDPRTGGPRTESILKFVGTAVAVMVAVSVVRRIFR